MNDCYSLPTVPVAQGTEQLPSKQRAAGSNPAWDANSNLNSIYLAYATNKTFLQKPALPLTPLQRVQDYMLQGYLQTRQKS